MAMARLFGAFLASRPMMLHGDGCALGLDAILRTGSVHGELLVNGADGPLDAQQDYPSRRPREPIAKPKNEARLDGFSCVRHWVRLTEMRVPCNLVDCVRW